MGILVLAVMVVLAAAPFAGAQTPISQAGWTVQSVDSQDSCCGGAYLATNSIDGNPNTFWHTVWSNGAPPPPHQIVINLNASHSISGFRYLPRQDGSPNGRIGQYEFYVSTDGSTWGAPVASGTFPNTATEKEVLFPAKTGSYVWLKALTEVEGRPYTSMAELNVLTGSAASGDAVAFGVGIVKVKRGSGTSDIWAHYSTRLGSPLGSDLASQGFEHAGDTTGGTFRFTCNNTSHNVCEVSVAAAALATPAGEQVGVYPRVLIQRQDFVNAGPQQYCEYGDGSTGAAPVGIVTQAPTKTPAYTPMQLNIGGTADCPGTPVTTAGDVNVITVGPGYYDVFTTFVFKKVTTP